MGNNKIKLLNFILLLDFTIHIFTNLIIYKLSPSIKYSIFLLSVRDISVFLLSIFIYIYFLNNKVSSLILFPKINNKIIKNSVIVGVAFYFISNGVNIIFTNIFKFTLKNTVYLNNILDMYDLSFKFVVYIFISTIFTELFFRVVLNDAFRFLSYKTKLFISAFIYAVFFFGLSQFFYGITLGILLMSFLNNVGNTSAVIIASIVANILNYLAKLIGKNVINDEISRIVASNSGNTFVEIIFPIIVTLIGLILYPAFMDKIKGKVKQKENKLTNVTEVNFNAGISNVVDLYFILFVVFTMIIYFISYIFLG